jgi:hypothetical protein
MTILITVSKSTADRLSFIMKKKGYKTYDQVIRYLLDIESDCIDQLIKLDKDVQEIKEELKDLKASKNESDKL